MSAAAIGGLGVRVTNALTVPKMGRLNDAEYYHVQANLLAKGHGFSDPFLWHVTRKLVPAAVHPPLFPLFLSISSLFGGTSLLAHRIATGAIGGLTIVAIALIARELAGRAAGIAAAVLAAIYPNLWGLEGSLMSESLAAALVAVSLFFAIRLAKEPTTRTAVLLAIAVALATLTRPDTLLFLPILVLPVIVTRRALTPRRKVRLCAVVVVVIAVVLAPWLFRNLTRFSRPVVFSTNSDQVIGVANCTPTYYWPAFLGYWAYACNGHLDVADQAERSALERRRGLRYVRSHLDRFLGTVVWARLGRAADVYRPFENARYSAAEGRRLNVAYAGLWVYWACLPFALVGSIVLWRRDRSAVRILLTPFVVAMLTAIYAYGAVRFRAIAEPSLIVLAAVGIIACWRSVRTRRETTLV